MPAPETRSPLYLLLVGLALLAGLLACRVSAAPSATPTPQLIAIQAELPSATFTASPSPTPAPTSTPTLTPTFTPLPTRTPRPAPSATPRPSPTPRGEFVHTGLGFSFTRPDSWLVEENSESFVAFRDRFSKYVFLAYSFYGDDRMTVSDVADDVANMFFRTTVHSRREEEINLANGLTAPSVRMTLKTPGGYIACHVVYVRQGYRGYVFLTYSNPNQQELNPERITQFFASLRLFLPELQGLDQTETLVLLGPEPEAADLDPARSEAGPGGYAGLLFSGLVRLAPDLQIVPDLAETWAISPDGLTYTFHLRPDLQFASGRALTAQDVKDSWERAADPATSSLTAGYVLGSIQGAAEKLAGSAPTLSGVQPLDDRTLQVSLARPEPHFLAKLSQPAAFVTDSDETRGNLADWAFAPNASGPYRLRNQQGEDGLAFERNPAYHTPAAVPYLVYLHYSDWASLTLFDEDILDIAPLDPASAALVRRADHPHHAAWQTGAGLCTTLLQVDPAQAPMDDPAVRQAFSLALDKASLVDRLSENLYQPAAGLLPPGMPGYTAPSPAAFDPAAARAALAASRYAGGLPTVTLTAPGYGDTRRDDIAALVEMWRQNLGVEVKVEYLDPGDYTTAARRRHGQLVYTVWCADYPDPDSLLTNLFASASPFNLSAYSDPATDELLAAAGREFDPALRLAQFVAVESALLADWAAIPLWHPVQDVLVRERVQGYRVSPLQSLFVPWITLGP